jgi:hypothetical protein
LVLSVAYHELLQRLCVKDAYYLLQLIGFVESVDYYDPLRRFFGEDAQRVESSFFLRRLCHLLQWIELIGSVDRWDSP